MTDEKQNKQKGGVNPVVAAVTGVFIGAAAVGVAGAAILANDKSRKKVEKIIDKVKDNVSDMKADVEKKLLKDKKE